MPHVSHTGFYVNISYFYFISFIWGYYFKIWKFCDIRHSLQFHARWEIPSCWRGVPNSGQKGAYLLSAGKVPILPPLSLGVRNLL